MNLPNYTYPNVNPPARILDSPFAATAGSRGHVGSYMNRQTRFDARSRRRYGDWSILEIPTFMLWLEEADDEAPDPENPYAY
jgi:hypothetical protein